jgi:non-ribosomal peptide synthetase component E (peptide arylation enzyme)
LAQNTPHKTRRPSRRTFFAKEKLTPYEVPKVIEFMDALPLTAVGKLDKKKLRK